MHHGVNIACKQRWRIAREMYRMNGELVFVVCGMNMPLSGSLFKKHGAVLRLLYQDASKQGRGENIKYI